MVDKYTINIGDRVAYRAAFLRSIGDYSGYSASKRGTVTAIVFPLHSGALLSVAWDDGFKSNVNSNNLIRADCIHLEPV